MAARGRVLGGEFALGGRKGSRNDHLISAEYRISVLIRCGRHWVLRLVLDGASGAGLAARCRCPLPLPLPVLVLVPDSPVWPKF
jgi:hypothetical protein